MKKFKIVVTIFLILTTFLGCTSEIKTNNTSSKNNSKINNKHTTQNEVIKNMISTHEIIEKLASDEFEGRLTGSKGNDKCVEYIDEIFKTIGLHPFNDTFHHTYTQDPLEVYGENSVTENKTMVNVIGKIPGKNHKKAIFMTQ